MYVPIHLKAYKDESDKGPYPVPMDAPIEGMRDDGKNFGGDRHVLVIDRDTNRLYEMGRAFPQDDISWTRGRAAPFSIWIQTRCGQPRSRAGPAPTPPACRFFRAWCVTTKSRAGLIPHALRFTVAQSRRAYVKPANHWASSNDDPDLPPMGMRVRLKANYQIPG